MALNRIVKVKHSLGSTTTLGGIEIANNTWYTLSDNTELISMQNDVYVHECIYAGNVLINNGSVDLSYQAAHDWLMGNLATEVKSLSELSCEWSCIKNFFVSNPGCVMNYFERTYDYYLWAEYKHQRMFISEFVKDTDDCDDFEANYKSLCNIREEPKVRITTCKIGRRLHDRYISFTTADQDNFDNTDYNNEDFGDVTYKMYKWVNGERVLTTTNSEATETWLEFEPTWDYEIASGSLDIPSTLPGTQNDWELHVVAVPDIPATSGGCINLIANPRLKYKLGKTVLVDSSINPAEMLYDATYHTNKIRFMIFHPAGEQADMQINVKLYR